MSKFVIILNSLHMRKRRANLHQSLTQLQYHDDALMYKSKKIVKQQELRHKHRLLRRWVGKLRSI